MRVYTGGTFDLFHAGHVAFLEKASEFGELYVALNRDEFVERFKGQRPIMTFEERFKVVGACKHVRNVIPNLGDEDSRLAIRRVQPQLIVIGDDWLGRDYLGQLGIDRDFLHHHGIGVLFLPYTRGISTTDILRRAGVPRERTGLAKDAREPHVPDGETVTDPVSSFRVRPRDGFADARGVSVS